uniref:Uncharacterized protein n=1 Tax=Schizaphis graminum TaxID=13262 RepID=A0A2S2NCM6_SCHGA
MNNNNVNTSENAKEKRSSAATASRTSAIVPRTTRPNYLWTMAETNYGPPRSPSTWSVTAYEPNGHPNSGTPRSLYNNVMDYNPLIPPPSYPVTRAIQYAPPPPMSVKQMMENFYFTRTLQQYSWTAPPDNRNNYNNNASSSSLLQLISRDMMPPLMPSLLTERRGKLCLYEQMRPTRGTPMVLECTQGDVRIRFCSTCNALWPSTGVPATHVSGGCAVTKMFPENCVPRFECNNCSIRYRLDDIGIHVAGAFHYVEFDELIEPSLSCLCVECNTIMYTPWSVFLEHRRKVHGKINGDSFLQNKQETRKPMVMIVMRCLIRDYLTNGRKDLLYVCMLCQHFGKDPCNVRKPCNVCNDTDNKFYCEHCNAIFSCLQSGYDIHRLTFEHFYIMQNRQYMANRFDRRRRA